MECKKEANLKECNCSYGGCSRKGRCCECISHHLKLQELPACFFSPKAEASYDRSIANFVEDRKSSSA